jgi:hypothetical protein
MRLHEKEIGFPGLLIKSLVFSYKLKDPEIIMVNIFARTSRSIGLNTDYIVLFFELICCFIFCFTFIYIGLYSQSSHILFTFFKASINSNTIIPVGAVLFVLSIIFSFSMILGYWIKIDWFGKLLQKTRLSHRRMILIGITAAICLSVVPLFISWSTANPNYGTIGGLVPFSDANGYYIGAENLLNNGQIDSWNQRRPLNAVLFAERLVVTNFNFRNALILQAIFFGVSAYLAAFAVGRTFGKMAGILVFFGLFAFAAPYIPLTLSETLGISLGSLGFALLLYGVSGRHRAAFFTGMVILTLALTARAGNMLILPALILFSGYLFREKQKYNYSLALLALGCVGVGFLINLALIWFYGDGTGLFLSNYAYGLYGIAAGGKGWTQIYLDYPQQIASLGSESAVNTFIYQKAFEIIWSNPFAFLQTLLKLFISDIFLFLEEITFQCIYLIDASGLISRFIHLDFPQRFAVNFFILPIIIIIICLIRFFVLCKNNEIKLFLFAGLSGFILSLPFFYSDAGLRLTAATFPFIATGIAVLFTSLLPRVCFQKGQKKHVRSKRFRFLQFTVPATISVIIIISALFGPIVLPSLATTLTNPPDISQVNSSCAANQNSFVTRIDPGMPYLLVHDDNYQQPTFSPDVQAKDMKLDSWDYDPVINSFSSSKHEPPYSFILGYHPNSNYTYYFYVNGTLIGNERHFMHICAEPYSNEPGVVWVVKNASIIESSNT